MCLTPKMPAMPTPVAPPPGQEAKTPDINAVRRPRAGTAGGTSGGIAGGTLLTSDVAGGMNQVMTGRGGRGGTLLGG